MRTTIQIEDGLFRQVKKLAAERGQSMSALIEGALRETLDRTVQPHSLPPVELIESKEDSGLCPGVNLDSFASLLDLMESERAAP